MGIRSCRGTKRRTCSASVLGRRGSQGSFFLLFADSGWNGNEREEVEMLRMNLFTTSLYQLCVTIVE